MPGEPLRRDRRRRRAVQLRAVLRVRHLLPRLQRGGGDRLELPRRRPGGRLQARMTTVVACLRWTDLRPEVDPLEGTVRRDVASAGFATAEQAALEHAL